jgi:hypothetical protein
MLRLVARVMFSAGLIFLILKNNYYIKKKQETR